MKKPQLLLIEDDPFWSDRAREALVARDYDVTVADTKEVAESLLRSEAFDGAIFDLHLTHKNDCGDRAGLMLGLQFPKLPRVLWTAELKDSEMAVEAHRGGMRVSLKSKDFADLLAAVRAVLGTRVFLVHGRDSMRSTVEWFLRAQGLHVVVLADQAGGSHTAVELFEQHSRVDYAVVLMTGDDEGRLRGSDQPLLPRARQNVLFELGYFSAILGRHRLFVLVADGVEMPSDFAGVRYIRFGDDGEWQRRLADEFTRARLPIANL